VYEGSFSSTSLSAFVVDGVLDGSYSNRVRWNVSVVLICISFMARDGDHFFMCFLAIWTSSFKKVLFSLVAHFFIGSLILGPLVFFFFYILTFIPQFECLCSHLKKSSFMNFVWLF
jgi:hypothetical protein